MSKTPTLFLGFTLVVLAAALALLWQAFGPRPAPPAVASRPPAVRTPISAEGLGGEPGVRTILPGPRPSGARPPEAVPATQAARTPAAPVALPAPEPAPDRSAALVPPAAEAVPASPIERGPESTAEGVDLNTAPLDQLNALGAGMIGRTIIAGRPYATPDDLLARRILNRRDFETIRPRVSVR